MVVEDSFESPPRNSGFESFVQSSMFKSVVTTVEIIGSITFCFDTLVQFLTFSMFGRAEKLEVLLMVFDFSSIALIFSSII